ESRGFGRASLRDIQAAAGEAGGDGGNGPDSCQISAAFQDTPPAVLAAKLAAARTATENVTAIDKLFSDKLPGQGPDFEELIKVVKLLIRTLAERAGADDEAPAEA